jgi:hypothetical protein
LDDAPDYAGDWFPSLAHRRLKLIKTDGSFAYRAVTACSDLGATHELALDSPLAGALERVEFLETGRLESDEVQVRWGGTRFEVQVSALVVQQ